MNLQTIKQNFKRGQMDIKEIGWLINELERTQQEFASMDESVSEFDTIIPELEKENKKLREQIQDFKRKSTWPIYEENLKLAQELALIKGEMSG